MTTELSNKKMARIAGLIYLGVVLTGIFSLMYMPSKLIVPGNSSSTFQNIVASEPLFRLWIVTGLLCYTFFLFLPLVLYKLLKPVNENHTKLMVLLAVISVPLFFLILKMNLACFHLWVRKKVNMVYQLNRSNRRLCYILTSMTMA